MFLKSLFLCVTVLALSGCATISKEGEKVAVVSEVDKECKNLGPVTVSVTGWGLPAESMNVLRNNTADKGGNTLIQTAENAGIAYDCPADSKRM
jgi:hypothetical protein